MVHQRKNFKKLLWYTFNSALIEKAGAFSQHQCFTAADRTSFLNLKSPVYYVFKSLPTVNTAVIYVYNQQRH